MRLLILSVGRPGDEEASALHDRYVRRIRRFGVACEIRWVDEVRAGGRYSDEHVRERESAALLEVARGSGVLIALDRRGTCLTSEQLADRLPRWAEPRAAFALGGPLGHHRALVERADVVWSLSTLTLPHELARVVVVEQIYRALTIGRRIPYHK